MSRFSEVNFSASAQTVEIGAGLIWDDVYAALDPHNVSVVGGRASGIGVAGFTLGGGMLSSEYLRAFVSNFYPLIFRLLLAHQPTWINR